jgi:hypothetical protein
MRAEEAPFLADVLPDRISAPIGGPLRWSVAALKGKARGPMDIQTEMRRLIALERGQIVLAVSSAIAGGIIGWLLPVLFADPKKLELWLVLSAAILVIVASATGLSFNALLRRTADDSLLAVKKEVVTCSTETQHKFTQILAANKEILQLVDESVGRQAVLILRDQVYRELAISIRNAKTEVAMISYLMVDWETSRRTFLPASVDTPFRAEFYDAVYEAIRNPKLSYIRVWEVPHQRRDEAMQVIETDEFHKKECTLIKEVSKTRPDLARLVIADTLTTASFILIDRKNLFLNIDFFEPEKSLWYSPYMLFIKDASGDSFSELQSVIVRLTGRA